MKKWLLFLIGGLWASLSFSQEDVLSDTTVFQGYLVPAKWIDGEWAPHVNLRQINILPPVRFRNERERRRYTKMEYNIRKVYPYAIKIQEVFADVTHAVDSIESKKEKKAYINRREEQLKAEFETKLRRLTFSQGRLLLKLVDRQTGETTYEVVKQLKGTFSAFFWQSVARIFGANLKAEYDEKGDDWMIEDIITRLENGQL